MFGANPDGMERSGVAVFAMQFNPSRYPKVLEVVLAY